MALAYLDLDLYEGMKVCLEQLLPRMPNGAVLAFDELCWPRWPRETVALLEMVELSKARLSRFPWFGTGSYAVLE